MGAFTIRYVETHSGNRLSKARFLLAVITKQYLEID